MTRHNEIGPPKKHGNLQEGWGEPTPRGESRKLFYKKCVNFSGGELRYSKFVWIRKGDVSCWTDGGGRNQTQLAASGKYTEQEQR